MREPVYIYQDVTPASKQVTIDLAEYRSAAGACSTTDPGPDPSDDPDEFPTKGAPCMT